MAVPRAKKKKDNYKDNISQRIGFFYVQIYLNLFAESIVNYMEILVEKYIVQRMEEVNEKRRIYI